MKHHIPGKAAIGDKYHPAMRIIKQEEADEYFEALVLWTLSNVAGISREEAENIEKANLGYFAGYFDHKTRLRVEKLFRCNHPVFGSASSGAPTPEHALKLGELMGSKKGGKKK